MGRYLRNRIASPGGLLRAVGTEPVLAQCGPPRIINFLNIMNVCYFIFIKMFSFSICLLNAGYRIFTKQVEAAFLK